MGDNQVTERKGKREAQGKTLSESEWPWLAATPPVVGAAAAPGSPETEAREAESAMAEPMVVVDKGLWRRWRRRPRPRLQD